MGKEREHVGKTVVVGQLAANAIGIWPVAACLCIR